MGRPLTENDYREVQQFLEKEKTYFKTHNLFFPIAGDFYYASSDYPAIQALVEHFKSNENFEFKFSTLSQYSDNVLSEIDKNALPKQYGDFFPYIDSDPYSWTGFYTSKAMFKKLVRGTTKYLQAMRIFAAKISFFLGEDERFDLISNKLDALQQVCSVLQHHDAITGTMNQMVKFDYDRMITKAVSELESALLPSFKAYLKGVLQEELIDNKFQFQFFNLFIEDTGELTLENVNDTLNTNSSYTVAAFNPGREKKFLLKLQLPKSNHLQISILSSDQQVIKPDVLCITTQKKEKECWIYFTDTIQDFGLKLYKVQFEMEELQLITPTTLQVNQALNINKNAHIQIKENLETILSNHWPSESEHETQAETCQTRTVQIKYAYYQSKDQQPNPSGAYIFTPKKNTNLTALPAPTAINAFVGEHVTILQFVRDSLDSFIIFDSLNYELPGFEIQTKIYGVPFHERGREFVIQVIDNEIKNEGAFYVDQNGYYMAKRVYGKKDYYVPNNNNDIQKNYYPMTAASYVKNADRRLTILTDRPQGVSSTMDGEIQIMLHRTALADDNKGVDEELYELSQTTRQPINVTTTHYVLFTNAEDSDSFARKLQVKQDQALQYWIFQSEKTFFDFNPQLNEPQLSALDANVKISMLIPSLTEVYVTLQNLNEKSHELNLCDSKSSQSVLFNRISPGSNVKILSVQEKTWNTLVVKESNVVCGTP